MGVPADALAAYRTLWHRKPILRLIYDDFYIAAACRLRLTIEIGGGIGNHKRRLTDAVATDIQSASWLDCVADAQRLPFANEVVANIVMVDVRWHGPSHAADGARARAGARPRRGISNDAHRRKSALSPLRPERCRVAPTKHLYSSLPRPKRATFLR
jgi:hypothetical protein